MDKKVGTLNTPVEPPTLRDWFAGQALIGLLSNSNSNSEGTYVSYTAYTIADAMLFERNIKR